MAVNGTLNGLGTVKLPSVGIRITPDSACAGVLAAIPVLPSSGGALSGLLSIPVG